MSHQTTETTASGFLPDERDYAIYEAIHRQGRPLEDVAKEFGIAPATVRSIFHRTKNAFADHWFEASRRSDERELADQLGRLESMWTLVMNEWHRSRKDAETVQTIKKVRQTENVTKTTRKVQYGQVRYIDQARKLLTEARIVRAMLNALTAKNASAQVARTLAETIAEMTQAMGVKAATEVVTTPPVVPVASVTPVVVPTPVATPVDAPIGPTPVPSPVVVPVAPVATPVATIAPVVKVVSHPVDLAVIAGVEHEAAIAAKKAQVAAAIQASKESPKVVLAESPALPTSPALPLEPAAESLGPRPSPGASGACHPQASAPSPRKQRTLLEAMQAADPDDPQAAHRIFQEFSHLPAAEFDAAFADELDEKMAG